jgi:hypothetical protein
MLRILADVAHEYREPAEQAAEGAPLAAAAG